MGIVQGLREELRGVLREEVAELRKALDSVVVRVAAQDEALEALIVAVSEMKLPWWRQLFLRNRPIVLKRTS